MILHRPSGPASLRMTLGQGPKRSEGVRPQVIWRERILAEGATGLSRIERRASLVMRSEIHQESWLIEDLWSFFRLYLK